jgi:hypothetical protein
MIVECRCSLCCQLPKGYDLINHRQALRHQRRHPVFAIRQAAQVRSRERREERSQRRPELPERDGVEREQMYVRFLSDVKHLFPKGVALNAVSMGFATQKSRY